MAEPNRIGTVHAHPHIRFRLVDHRTEPFLPDTGLAVWEIAWLGRAYGNDAAAIAEHTGAEQALIEEGLCYAAEHRNEVDAAIQHHTDVPLERLLELFPGMRIVTLGEDEQERDT